MWAGAFLDCRLATDLNILVVRAADKNDGFRLTPGNRANEWVQALLLEKVWSERRYKPYQVQIEADVKWVDVRPPYTCTEWAWHLLLRLLQFTVYTSLYKPEYGSAPGLTYYTRIATEYIHVYIDCNFDQIKPNFFYYRQNKSSDLNHQ